MPSSDDVVVNAMIAALGNICLRMSKSLYLGLKLSLHCTVQWASMKMNETLSAHGAFVNSFMVSLLRKSSGCPKKYFTSMLLDDLRELLGKFKKEDGNVYTHYNDSPSNPILSLWFFIKKKVHI